MKNVLLLLWALFLVIELLLIFLIGALALPLCLILTNTFIEEKMVWWFASYQERWNKWKNTKPSFTHGFKIVIGFLFIILSVLFGSSLNYETPNLEFKVFVCFLAFLQGIFILIQFNDKSAT
jgi:hypothetical protein